MSQVIKSVKERTEIILSAFKGCEQFLKAYAEFIVKQDNYKEIFEKLQPEFEKFMSNREASHENLVDIVNQGTLFLLSSNKFFRAEHIMENVKLTDAEKLEMQEEADALFRSSEGRELVMSYAALLGLNVYKAIQKFIDMEAHELEVQKTLNKLREGISAGITLRYMEDGAKAIGHVQILAERLEGCGISVKEDGAVVFEDEHAKNNYDKTPPELFDRDSEENRKAKEQFEKFKSPLLQELLKMDKIEKL